MPRSVPLAAAAVKLLAELPRCGDSVLPAANGADRCLYLIGKVLGHKQARTTEIYAHLADDPVGAVADRTAARIAAAMAPAGGRDPANVVPLRSSRP